MTKLIYNAKLTRIEAKDGRKVIWSIPTGTIPEATILGLIEGADPESPDLQATLEAAVAEAAKRKGSVIPDDYRYRYGADQNCGDEMARNLTDRVTKPEGVDLEACRDIAARNGIEDRFDQWLARDLNPGMVRMNLGNVLRGKLRRGETVTL